ncbi:MAG: formylglycine-generating enzyme family protein [Magnetococcales bacterium]|nr:formylglycine-generating enzyme family protein [Magnetococcales bacterium]
MRLLVLDPEHRPEAREAMRLFSREGFGGWAEASMVAGERVLWHKIPLQRARPPGRWAYGSALIGVIGMLVMGTGLAKPDLVARLFPPEPEFRFLTDTPPWALLTPEEPLRFYDRRQRNGPVRISVNDWPETILLAQRDVQGRWYYELTPDERLFSDNSPSYLRLGYGDLRHGPFVFYSLSGFPVKLTGIRNDNQQGVQFSWSLSSEITDASILSFHLYHLGREIEKPPPRTRTFQTAISAPKGGSFRLLVKVQGPGTATMIFPSNRFVMDESPDMEFVQIPPGCFQMGSPKTDKDRDDDEGPVHKVCVDAFWMGRYEVTQKQWKAVMGTNPSYFASCGDECPVEQVSWEDAQDFIRKLDKQQDGCTYRLPTEAEWEYACRSGGKNETYCGGNDVNRVAWDRTNSENTTYRVGGKAPNGLGLYDMSGNVWEWVSDWYDGKFYANSPRDNPKGPSSGSARVGRGGGWDSNPANVRSAYRNYDGPGSRYSGLGFRLSRTCP